jgi:thioredoxin-like negative regulator of GroEL
LSKPAPGNLIPIPMMAEWGLESEPWVFVVGVDGRLAARFEGVVTEDEIVEILDALLEQPQ